MLGWLISTLIFAGPQPSCFPTKLFYDHAIYDHDNIMNDHVQHHILIMIQVDIGGHPPIPTGSS
jgi:hypothetical protein